MTEFIPKHYAYQGMTTILSLTTRIKHEFIRTCE
ncbi:hypothetical protein XFLM_00080 [Xylella fastidiosa subsp. fastidiosa GB514]|nr:hypothetical protein XFLM_00080 [Xylella fastidiosa subsp. fastidiosa GB514]